jgi:hypothetical protein
MWGGLPGWVRRPGWLPPLGRGHDRLRRVVGGRGRGGKRDSRAAGPTAERQCLAQRHLPSANGLPRARCRCSSTSDTRRTGERTPRSWRDSPDLGQVAHTGCRRVPCRPEYQNRPCGITDTAWAPCNECGLAMDSPLNRVRGLSRCLMPAVLEHSTAGGPTSLAHLSPII